MDELSAVAGCFDMERYMHNYDLLAAQKSRIAYTDDEEEAHLALRQILEENEIPCSYDCIGDTIGKIGKRQGPAVKILSHLDNIGYGQVDGILGVAIGLEVLIALKKHQADLISPVELWALRAEESTRFHKSLNASGLLSGSIRPEDLHGCLDDQKISMHEAICRLGNYCPDDISRWIWTPENTLLAMEGHAEQGPTLYEEKIPVGIVSSIAAPIRYKVTLLGLDNHSGGCSPKYRRDALCAASQMTLALEEVALEADEQMSLVNQVFRATVSNLCVYEYSINKIPGRVELLLDIRGSSDQSRSAYEAAIIKKFCKIAESREVDIEFEPLDIKNPVPSLDENVYKQAAETARQLAIPFKMMGSGASHDIVNFYHAKIASLLLFADSIDGLAHNRYEKTTDRSQESLGRLMTAHAYKAATGGI